MNQDNVSLTTIYSECNNHLRDMDKNRDQLTNFYILIVGAFLAAFQYLNDNFKDILVLSSFLLFILGVIIFITTHEFRLWHTRYSYTIILLGALSRSEKKEFVSIENKLRKYSYLETQLQITSCHMPFSWIYKRHIKGTEGYTSLITPTVAFFPFYILVFYLFPTIQNMISKPLEVVVFFLVFHLLFIYFSARNLYSRYYKCPWASWLFYGIDKDLDLILEPNQKNFS